MKEQPKEFLDYVEENEKVCYGIDFNGMRALLTRYSVFNGCKTKIEVSYYAKDNTVKNIVLFGEYEPSFGTCERSALKKLIETEQSGEFSIIEEIKENKVFISEEKFNAIMAL